MTGVIKCPLHLDKATELGGVVPVLGSDIPVEDGGVGGHPGGHQGPVTLPHTHGVVLETGDHRVLAKLGAVPLHKSPAKNICKFGERYMYMLNSPASSTAKADCAINRLFKERTVKTAR